MIRTIFNKLKDELLAEADSLMNCKNEDYTKGNEDYLANFKEGNLFGISPLQTCGLFMKKHMDAIYNYIKSGGQSESEPIRERIKDAINYLILLNALIEEHEISEGTEKEN